MGNYWNLNAKQRRGYGLTKKLLIALVVWVSNKCNTGGNQLWPGGLNKDFAFGPIKANAVIGTRLVAIFKLGLSNRGPESYIPKGWGHGLVGLAARKVV